MQTPVLVLLALVAVVVVGVVWGVVRTVRAASVSRRLMAVTPVTGRVLSSEVVESNFYVHSGDSPGTVTPVGARHFTKRVETIEYPIPDGRVLRGSPALGEVTVPDRTGEQVRVHPDPQQPEVFIAPVGPQMSMLPIYLRLWGPIAFGVVFVCIFVCVGGMLLGTPDPGP